MERSDIGSPSGGPDGAALRRRSTISAKLERKSRKYAERSYFCPHCNTSVSLKTFKRHRVLYYNPDASVWTRAESSCGMDDCSTGMVMNVHNNSE